ncbi:transporter substrate-binding domain-containing protein [Pigmentiphaga aceris]|uniref:Transporter substrate-binding domain-containing protein n=1 Tax=Pigmentiphaga aceris TaxID=1940612 RepID=A0A5C0ASA3_9BURK|nr:transporter substrate-binding domain-containing protein [Pigmentiphaga aceris]QEI05112.1 transporter substrate-binding domain-containing protein [Pigmentiphaga aceris]
MPIPARLMHVALLAASLLMSGAVHAQDALSTIEKTKKIRIAIPVDYPPYGFVGPDLKPRGLDIDMANYVAAKLGASTVELVSVNSANRVPYLLSKKVDVIISTLGKTAEREKVVDFTHAYSPFYQAVFAAKSTKVAGWDDLAGKTVSVTRGAMAETELEKVMPKGTTVKRFDDHVGTVSAFMSGQVQVIATSVTEGAQMMEKNPQVEYKLLLKDSPNFMGVNKGEVALKNKLDQIILDGKKNGDLEKLAQKWLNRSTGDLPL